MHGLGVSRCQDGICMNCCLIVMYSATWDPSMEYINRREGSEYALMHVVFWQHCCVGVPLLYMDYLSIHITYMDYLSIHIILYYSVIINFEYNYICLFACCWHLVFQNAVHWTSKEQIEDVKTLFQLLVLLYLWVYLSCQYMEQYMKLYIDTNLSE